MASSTESMMVTVSSSVSPLANTTTAPLDWTWTPIVWEWWEILQLILAVLGIVGNGVVIIVLFRCGRKRCSTDILIAALAVADFLTSVFIIPHRSVNTLPDQTVAARAYCKVIDSSVLMWISICASIFTLTTISLERLVAVKYPYSFDRLFSPWRTHLAIIIIWVFAVILNTFSFYVHFAENGRCQLVFPSVAYQKFIGVAVFVTEYVVPVIVMVIAHALTYHALRRRTENIAAGDERKEANLKILAGRRRVIAMLLVVIVVFIICWTPDQFGFLLFNVGVVGFEHIFSPLYRVFVVLAFANSCANPFIYAARNANFRKALSECCCCGLTSSGAGKGYKSIFGGQRCSNRHPRH